jgi:hemoglobin
MKRCALLLALIGGACSGHAPSGAHGAALQPQAKPLYDRMGGMDVIDAVVADFVDVRLAKDDRVRDRFAKTDKRRLRALLADQICELSGGPCKYTGKSMPDAHAGLEIGEAELRVFLDDLRLSLVALHVPEREQSELIALLVRQYGAPPELPPGP